MERLEKKQIKGHTYYYYSRWEYVNGKCRRIWQKYLGKLEDIVKAVEGDGTTPDTAELFDWGLPTVFWRECCRTHLIPQIDRLCPKRTQGLSVGEYLALAAINRAIHPTSKRAFFNWFSTTTLRRYFPNASKTALASQRFWDHMTAISAEQTLLVWKQILQGVVEREKLDLSSVCYDGTNFYSFIDTFNMRSDLAKRGKNKQGRANLRQISYALFCSADDQLPLYYNVYEGNRNDTKQFPVMLRQFQAFLKELSGHTVQPSDVTVIFEKGNNSQKNFALIDELGLHYVGSKKLSEMKELAEVSNTDTRFTPCTTLGLEQTKAWRVTQSVYGQERTVVVTYNQELFQAQWLTLHNDIQKAISQLDLLRQKLQDRADGLVTKGRCPTLSSVTTQCRSILKRQYMKEVIAYHIKPGDDEKGIPRLTYEIDTQAMARLSKTYLGKNLLVTDRKQWSDEQIILAYRSQFHIENVFKEMKDRDIGNWWPVYHWTDQKIKVHGLYCTLALLLRALAYRRVQQGGMQISMKRMLSELNAIKEILLLYPRKRRAKQSRQQTVLSKTSELQQSLLSILEVTQENVAVRV